MSDIPEKKQGFNPNKKGMMSQVAEIDDEILTLLYKRSSLLSRVLGVRKKKGLSAVSPEQEKRLWGQWDRAAARLGLDPKSLRRIYGQLNNLGYNYDEPGGVGKNAPAYWIPQAKRPVDVTLPGPSSLEDTALYMSMAAALNKPARIKNVIINDNLSDLIKSFNQAGAKIDRDGDDLVVTPTDGLDLDDKLFFAGNDPFNLFVLMCLSLDTPGTTKFAGNVELKSLDLSLISDVLLDLGARARSLDPGNPGVPARVESGGRMAHEVKPSAKCPVSFLKALAVAALTFEHGLKIDISANADWQAELEGLAGAMKRVGARVTLTGQAIAIEPAEISFDQLGELPMDDVLCAYLLAIPAFAGGRVELTGTWPKESFRAGSIVKVLGKIVDIKFDVHADQPYIVSSMLPGKEVHVKEVGVGPWPELLPLYMALGTAMAEKGEVSVPAGESHHFEANEFMDRFGLKGRFEDSLIIIEQGAPAPTRPWACPSPHYAMALALVALKAGETGLTNPGELTSLWPHFFTIFNALPIIHQMPGKKEKHTDEPNKKGRRIRLD